MNVTVSVILYYWFYHSRIADNTIYYNGLDLVGKTWRCHNDCTRVVLTIVLVNSYLIILHIIMQTCIIRTVVKYTDK